ncbi:MAG TPA: alpha/beta fold hydrolase [Gaiellaceae bacterium]|nr:alpha/beta fold hydrolase [Gaiellaceae bacterium]
MRARLLVLVAALAFPATAHAGTFTKHDGAVTMDDGTTIATTVYVPDGDPPVAGWPGVILAHGFGGSRQEMNLLAETYFAPYGYAVMTYDARGHGRSGGLVTIAGPREVADLRELERSFAARRDVNGEKIGAWGISYGAGEVWLAAAQGVPFKAIDVCETWSDLFGALFPGGYPKTGVIAGLLSGIPASRLSPDLDWLPNAVIRGTDVDRVRAFAGQRSVAAALPGIRVPTMIVQGRRDFLFGIDQAIGAFQRLKGPKLLYLGDHGHAPSTFPAADTSYAMTLARAWLDHFVKGDDNGVDQEPRVQIAPDPWTGKPAEFPGLPPTRPLSYALLGGPNRIGWGGKVVRPAGTTRVKVENFGTPVVTVRAATTAGWDHLVALLTATTPKGTQIAVSAGAVATRPGTRTYSIPLFAQVTAIPAGSRLQVTFGSSATGMATGPLYLDLPPVGAPRLTVTQGVLRLSAMIRPIS